MNGLCLAVQIYLLGIEIYQVYDQKIEYLLDFYNIVDITEFVLYVFYVYYRERNLYILLPDHFHLASQKLSKEEREVRQWMPLLHFFLFIQALIRTMFYIRVFTGIGTQVQLIIVTLKDAMTFMIFLIYWIIFFSIAFELIGSGFVEEQETYLDNKVNRTFTNFLQVFRNSLGDLASPSYEYWTAREADAPGYTTFMITLIWIIWIANIVFVQIVLFNFLIAIVGDSYSTVTQDKVLYMFTHRCELNREAYLIIDGLRLLPDNFEMLMIMAKDDGINQNHLEWMECINKLKYVSQKKRKEVNKEIIQAIDEKFNNLEAQLSDILKKSRQ